MFTTISLRQSPSGIQILSLHKKKLKGYLEKQRMSLLRRGKEFSLESQFTEPYDSPLLLSLINPLQKPWDKKEALMTCILKQLNIFPLKEF